jgi:hypothetical protein
MHIAMLLHVPPPQLRLQQSVATAQGMLGATQVVGKEPMRESQAPFALQRPEQQLDPIEHGLPFRLQESMPSPPPSGLECELLWWQALWLSRATHNPR